MKIAVLKKGGERRILAGHLWVFSNEVEALEGSAEPGDAVLVRDHRGRVLGCGVWSARSLIAIRLYARGYKADLASELVAERVRRAWEARRLWLGDEARASRVFFAEADGLPGLVVDRFGDFLAVQCLHPAVDRRLEAVLDALAAAHGPAGVVLRNDAPARELEGLPREVGIARGEVPDRVEFRLHGLRLLADLRSGQKTGFFFDQRENYRLLRPVAAGARVLDAFCYSGAWGLHALSWGAREVTFVDASEEALELARANAAANGFGAVRFEREDVVALLKERARERDLYDLVVLDPPAFAKSKARADEAVRGYVNLNKWGMRCVRPGGYLVTCSCSHHVAPEDFVTVAALASREAGREVQVLAAGGQSPDHPWLPAMPETVYLKALVLRVL